MNTKQKGVERKRKEKLWHKMGGKESKDQQKRKYINTRNHRWGDGGNAGPRALRGGGGVVPLADGDVATGEYGRTGYPRGLKNSVCSLSSPSSS